MQLHASLPTLTEQFAVKHVVVKGLIFDHPDICVFWSSLQAESKKSKLPQLIHFHKVSRSRVLNISAPISKDNQPHPSIGGEPVAVYL